MMNLNTYLVSLGLALQFVLDPVANTHLLHAKVTQHGQRIVQLVGAAASLVVRKQHVNQGLGETLEMQRGFYMVFWFHIIR
jgi:hypothetical protein